jgi:hypothetical protein
MSTPMRPTCTRLLALMLSLGLILSNPAARAQDGQGFDCSSSSSK